MSKVRASLRRVDAVPPAVSHTAAHKRAAQRNSRAVHASSRADSCATVELLGSVILRAEQRRRNLER